MITLYMRLLSPYNWSASFSSADIQGLAKEVSCYDQSKYGMLTGDSLPGASRAKSWDQWKGDAKAGGI